MVKEACDAGRLRQVLALLARTTGRLTSKTDDDFEAEAAEDAIAYAAAQAIETERDRIRSENKRKRKQGLPTMPMPRREKLLTRKNDVGSDTSGSLESDDSQLHDAKKKKASKFTYEGRESHFVILLRHASLTDQRKYWVTTPWPSSPVCLITSALFVVY